MIHTREFRLDVAEQRARYEAIRNNPQCRILKDDKDYETVKDFDDDGKLSNITKHIFHTVTWEEEELFPE